MNIQSAINKEVFIPRDERMLVAVEVKRRRKKRLSFLPSGGKADYTTFICLSVTNRTPPQLFITKVKRFGGSSSYTRRTQWTVEQLRQVNGVNPNKDSPEFDLVFDNAVDQWVASSAPEKCIFIQILYHACQTYWEGRAGGLGKVGRLSKVAPASPDGDDAQAGPSDPKEAQAPKTRSLQARRKSMAPLKKPEFVNCQSKLTREAHTMNLVIYRCKAFFNRMRNLMTACRGRPPIRGRGGPRLAGGCMGSFVQRANVVLGERDQRLTRGEDKTVDLMHRAQRLADSAHKRALKQSK